ncbi:MAG: glycyl-radical enzyme activating protein, partial [Treponema sp.]|nr:glycyl-radical enzyme activating protein [Treponema sp.]
MTGLLFNIQKFSVHDGPGIRTLVFFKGCPLRCRWCSNPESWNANPEILWDEPKCVRCLRCTALCPPSVLEFAGGRIRSKAGCTGCGICAASCPNGALSAAGKSYSVDEALAVCLEDKVFYEESGGGVTLSGGEILLQHAFTAALLDALGRAGIHRALETSGYAGEEAWRRITGKCDLVLFDVKHYDRQRHFEGTGVYNDSIRENLRYCLEHGPKVLTRIPVIPGYNDGEEDASGFASFLLDLGIKETQFLPFHQFGSNKYRLLGRDYPFAGTGAL